MNIKELAQKYRDYIIERRRYYHQHPELSLKEYETVKKTFPNKMVTLSECGSVAKLTDQISAGAVWSWAMPWYDYDADKTKSLDNHQHANTDWWKDAMSAENVITRDQLPKFE